MKQTEKLDELVKLVGVSITPRRGRWRVKLGKKVTLDKPVDRLFASEKEACTYVESWTKDRANRAEAAKQLSDSEMTDAWEAVQMLNEVNVEFSIQEIVRKYIDSLPSADSVTIEELAEKYFLDREKRKVAGERHVQQLEYSFKPLYTVFGDTPVYEITVEDIDAALDSLHGFKGNKTYNNNHTNLSALFNFGVRKKHLNVNVCDEIQKKQVTHNEAGVFSPAEIKAVLDVAKQQHEQLYIVLSLQCFAGIRLAEAMRLTWGDLRSDTVVVSASKAKNSKRRTVPILPPLRAILKDFEDMPKNKKICNITMRSLEKPRERVAKAAGVIWKHNVMRHSFVTYRLIDLKNDNQTALEAGHNVSILHRHYKALISNEDKVAGEFWNLYNSKDIISIQANIKKS